MTNRIENLQQQYWEYHDWIRQLWSSPELYKTPKRLDSFLEGIRLDLVEMRGDIQLSPEISVIIPAINEQDDILFALRSIADNKTSNRKRVEVIVVDNGSTDDTREIALVSGVIVMTCEIKSYAPTRQKGLDNAKGEIVVYLDADSMIGPFYLKTISEILEDNQIHGVYGNTIYIDELGFNPKLEIYNVARRLIHSVKPKIVKNKVTSGAIIAVKRDALKNAGGFSEQECEGVRTMLGAGFNVKKIDKPELTSLSSGRRIIRSGVFNTSVRRSIGNLMDLIGKSPQSSFEQVRITKRIINHYKLLRT